VRDILPTVTLRPYSVELRSYQSIIAAIAVEMRSSLLKPLNFGGAISRKTASLNGPLARDAP
jgi:hypothetical protein